jgi:peptidoglycan lytic transglycosylase G
MTRPPDPRRDLEERRNERIRRVRAERGAPANSRRTFQPVVLLAWFAGVIALVGVLLFLGFLAFAPRLMVWIEDHPGSIEQGIVRDFVQWYRPQALADEPASDDGGRVSITIEGGATDSEIGEQLAAEGIIGSRLAFQWAVIQAGREGELQAGTYDLSASLRPSEIVAALYSEGGGPETEITIQEGWRLEEIVGYLGSSNLTMNLEQFASLATDPPPDVIRDHPFLADLPAGRTLEGYLAPNTYRVFQNASAREVLDVLLNSFGENLTDNMFNGFRRHGLTLDDAVNLASIVEREAVLDDERRLIAGVYLNRLNHPEAETVGLLNADPTLQYGLATAEFGESAVGDWGIIEWWDQLPAGGADVQLPENLAGYQTYLSKGLPPTPIAAPRTATLQAVARADTASGYFYFVAGCPGGERDGSHYFARTYAEHQANIAQANAECAGA